LRYVVDKREIKTLIAERWDRDSVTYDSHSAHGLHGDDEKREWLKLLRRLVGEKPCRILDVGAGTGFLSLLLGELGHICLGIDLSEGMLNQAREKANVQNIRGVSFEAGDAENLSSNDGVYDVVINRHLLWTLPHPREAIREWLRVTKKGGQVIIIDSDWFDDSPVIRFRKKLLSLFDAMSGRKHATGKFYDNDLIENLPLMRDQSTQHVFAIIREMGLEYTVCDARDVERAERRGKGIRGLLNRMPPRKIILLKK
jgi:ubiquinone/menaquinone biosynthesis C-methylase UbiE